MGRTILRSSIALAFVITTALFGSACSSDGDAASPNATPSSERPAICYGKCDGPSAGSYQSPYEVDMAALNAIFSGAKPMEKIEDAFSVEVALGAATFKAPTHLFGAPVNVIPYSDTDDVADASGTKLARGDEVISKVFPVGRVGYVIKHHRPAHRVLDGASGQSELKENMKLQDTHIGIVVGVERDGKAGAITINNPQTYQSGRFGAPDYPMVFVSPVLPSYVGAANEQAVIDNIRTMLVAFNTVSNFPGNYNGGDPLAASTPDKVKEHVVQMVKALTGDATAKAWFQDPAHQIYCAELAHVSTSAGLLFPLNDTTMVPLVGQALWDQFKAELAKHNAGTASAFTQGNGNAALVSLVKLALAPETLKAVPEYAPADKVQAERTKLAFQPMTMSDIVEQFLRTHVPREQLGETIAPVQGKMLESMKPGLLESMGMDQLPAEDPRRAAVEQLFGKLVETVSKSYDNYAQFRSAVEPLLAQARQVTGPRDDSGVGLFVPPSLLHVITQGKHNGGLMALRYEGHGVHVSATKQKANPQPPTPEPSVPSGQPYAGSCVASCGGFSPDIACACDEVCSRYGDCCADFATACPQ